jgi:hypothetical protein
METYQTRQMSTPTTRIPPLVEVPQQQHKPNKRNNQSARADQPPRPPQRLAAFEKRHGLFCKIAETLRDRG